MSSAVPVPKGSARGVAFMVGFGSIIALIVEVTGTTAATLRVSRGFCALDCGTVVNPDSVEAQIQGGIAHGISATLWGQVTFANGVPSASNFNNYRMVRSGDMPTVQLQTVSTGAIAIGGIGEVGVPCVAPAMAKAFAKLTGQRIRTLPFAPGAASNGDD